MTIFDHKKRYSIKPVLVYRGDIEDLDLILLILGLVPSLHAEHIAHADEAIFCNQVLKAIT